MTGKDNFLYILLCIITLGIYPILINNKKPAKISNKLSEVTKVTVDIKKLIELLGGKKNIAGNEYTYTKIKVFVYKREKVMIDKIKDLKGITGVVASSAFITLLVGKQAKKLAGLI